MVRKDLTTELEQNAVVPTWVLEYLLGQHLRLLNIELVCLAARFTST